ILLEQLAGPADEAVQAMIADEEYQAFRKRPLPTAFTDGREAYFLDVKIDNELLRGKSFLAAEFYFLVDPSPRGLILQIPEVTDAVPPSLPANLEVGGLYSINSGDGQFGVAKLLAYGDGICHVRIYAQKFSSRPATVDTSILSL